MRKLGCYQCEKALSCKVDILSSYTIKDKIDSNLVYGNQKFTNY